MPEVDNSTAAATFSSTLNQVKHKTQYEESLKILFCQNNMFLTMKYIKVTGNVDLLRPVVIYYNSILGLYHFYLELIHT